VYKVDPRFCSLACNLLSKDDCRAALRDEVGEGGPEVPLVRKPSAFTCRAERLARARASPDGLIVRPSGKTQGVSPSSNAGKEVTMAIACKVTGHNVFNAAFINMPIGDVSLLDQLTKPGCRLFVKFVVVDAHPSSVIR
jgi:hypothetical protein